MEKSEYDKLLYRYQQSLQELDLQQSQKSELQRIIQEQKLNNQLLERELVDIRASQNKFQQSVQMSIAQDKEQYMNWKDQANRLQRENELLEGKITEYQSLVEGLSAEEKDLSSSLKLRVEQLSRIQVENNSMKERYRQIQSELSESQNQIKVLREKIVTLEEERGEALRKASNQAIKYENYVEAVHKEKQQVGIFQAKTRKQIAGKILFKSLIQAMKNTKAKVIGKINVYANKRRFRMKQLVRLIQMVKQRVIKNNFDRWHKVLNWPGLKKQFHASINSNVHQNTLRQNFFK